MGHEPRRGKNGYVYVFLSNESTSPVYFDDFDVIHTRGVIVEDNAYYPYGLKIAGISSHAAIKPITKEGYQGDYTEHDEETGYNEFALRSYDAQIGRWIQNDPKEEFNSGYVGMGNNPINNVDRDGGGISFLAELAIGVGAGAIAGGIIAHNNGNDWWKGAISGAIIGGGVATATSWFTGAEGIKNAGGLTAAWKIASSSFITANVNLIQYSLAEQTKGQAWLQGLVGLASGGIGAYVESRFSDKLDSWTEKILEKTGLSIDFKESLGSFVNNGINGFFSRLIISKSQGNKGWSVIGHSFLGLGEGLANSFAFAGLSFGVDGRRFSPAIENTLASFGTAIPGAGLRIARASLFLGGLFALGEGLNADSRIYAIASLKNTALFLGIAAIDLQIARFKISDWLKNINYYDNFNIIK